MLFSDIKFHIFFIFSILFIGVNYIETSPETDFVEELRRTSSRSQSYTGTNKSCGYSSCPKTVSDKINVHIIAHTHDDVGWLKTVDQYYYGTKKHYSAVGVQHILDSVIPQLLMDKNKRFIYVEISFFAKWWAEQDEQMKTIVRNLVNEGRFEFINGGWCMNDEATVNYRSTIEQMTLGLKFLDETFGVCASPKVGWQIDPFGHTNEQASLFAQFGFDGMFFTRISYSDKDERIRNKRLDLVWHGDRALTGQTGSIYTNIFYDNYDAPSGFCFDVLCMDDNLVDNKKSYEYNMEYKGQEFIEILRQYSKAKMVNQVLVPLGGDFQFSAASQNFKNIDKLIKYVRKNAPDINIFYSTPSCYQYAVHQVVTDKALRLPEKYDDFMPYDSSLTVWWSGFFTSRPSVKLIEREVANLLQVTRIVSLANLLKSQVDNKSASWINGVRDHEARCLEELWEVLGDLQHHDAVTGTEKQHVANDYVRRAYDAIKQCSKFIGEFRRAKLNDFFKKANNYEKLKESGKRFKLDPVYLEETMFCPLLNISQCDAMEANVDVSKYQARLNAQTKNQSQTSSSEKLKQQRVKRYLIPTNQHVKSTQEIPPELQTRSVLLNAYNPLARQIPQHGIRLPCNGQCELDRVRVIHLATNETMKSIRLPVPSGVTELPFRDARTNYEILFYANLPALGYTSFIIEDNNNEEIVDEEIEFSDSVVVTDEQQDKKNQAIRSRRIRDTTQEEENQDHKRQGSFEYFTMSLEDSSRIRRESSLSQQSSADKVIVKFDMNTGMIVGLKRVSDGSVLQISQKFGYYFPANTGSEPGAYIFRPNTSEPHLFDKPSVYKMFKRKNGALIEIHQKWASWLWQTIRVDAKKNYIEFDYVVGPIPITHDNKGREVVSRYITNMQNKGVFMTDSNARQLLTRQRFKSEDAEQLGGSFYPVVSTIMLRNNAIRNQSNQQNGKECNKCPAEAVAILVDRSQAGTSLNEGQLELLIHRRQMRDDKFGVGEALDEPGEDGRGLVTRGKHRLYLKFYDSTNEQFSRSVDIEQQTSSSSDKSKIQMFQLPQTPRENLIHERDKHNLYPTTTQFLQQDPPTYIVNDQVINDLKQESVKFALSPVLTFDRLRVTANEFLEMLASNENSNNKIKTDLTLLNVTLPGNVHLLTLQPWSSGSKKILVRLENLDNPLTVHPYPDYTTYQRLVNSYKSLSGNQSNTDEGNSYDVENNFRNCEDKFKLAVEVDLKYLIRKIRIVSLEEFSLGANSRLKDSSRLDWTDEENCDSYLSETTLKLRPRQIRTFLASFEFL